jgi:hypothetical protein
MEPSDEQGQMSDAQKLKLAGYVKSLQTNLSDLTLPYRIPLSQILPEERQVSKVEIFDDIDLEAIYDHLTDWEGRISKKKIRDWLNQFEAFIDKNIAYLLLQNFQYFSKVSTQQAVSLLRRKLLNNLRQQPNLRKASFANSVAQNQLDFEAWLEGSLFHYAILPSPGNTSIESQHRLWAIYEKFALSHCPNVRKFKPLEEMFKGSSCEPRNSVFVFMDYTNGSGNQLDKCGKKICELLKIEEYSRWKDAIFVFLYVVESPSFNISNITTPQNSVTIRYEEMRHYRSSQVLNAISEHGISETEYESFIGKYCLISTGEESVGYRGGGFLTCHHYSCPNNTLPFFYKRSNNWIPLFETSQKPTAKRYKKR